MQAKTSIVKKLIAYFLLLNIFTVIVVSSYSYFRAKDALVERTFDQLTSLRIEKKYRVERFFNDKILDIGWISKSDELENIVGLLNKSPENKTPFNKLVKTEFENLIGKHFFSGDSYKRIYITGENGETIYFDLSSPDSTWLNTSINKELPILNLWETTKQNPSILIEDYKVKSEVSEPAIFIGAPVFNVNSKMTGFVAVEIDIDAINSIMFENNPHNGLGKSGESYLVGNDFLMRSTSRFHDNSVFNTEVNTLGVQKVLSGETGAGVIKDYRGVDVLSSYEKIDIDGLQWVVLSEIDEKEAMIPIDSIRNNIMYLSVLMSLLLFAFVYILAKRISMPIVKLKDAAQKITTGNYDVFVEDIVSNDEIGSLIDAFNEMSLKIKEQTENIKLERSMRLSSMIDGQELERQRLSRELHDGLGQSILAIKMRLERMSNASEEKAKLIMEEVQELFVNTIQEVRSISNNLMPAVLNEFGLVDALSNLCRDVAKSTGINVELNHVDYTFESNDKINTYLYRISQEALNNIIKHSKAQNAYIDLQCDNTTARIYIKDDGQGFNYLEDRKMCGNGISNIKERVNLLNGEIQITSIKNGGTVISIVIPKDLNSDGEN
jgi:signal transduction histidine kinase